MSKLIVLVLGTEFAAATRRNGLFDQLRIMFGGTLCYVNFA